MYRNYIGIQIKSLRSCVATTADGQFKTNVEYQSNEELQNLKSAEEKNTSQLKVQSYSLSSTNSQIEVSRLQLIDLDSQDFTPQKILQIIFETIMRVAKETSNIEFDSLAYTLPTNFDQSQKQIVQEAGTKANVKMQNIDLHCAVVMAFSMVKIIDLKDNILIFYLSDGGMVVTLLISEGNEFVVDVEFETKFKPQIMTKSKLDELWHKYGIQIVQEAQHRSKESFVVLLVGDYADDIMLHMQDLLVQVLDNRDLLFYINPWWAIAQGAALIALKLEAQNYSKIKEPPFSTTMTLDEIYQSFKKEDEKNQTLLINQMESQSKPLFKEYCLKTEHFKDKEYKQKLSLINMLAKKNKLTDCNQLIQSCYDKDRHRGYTLYLNLFSTIKGLKDPNIDDNDDGNINSLILVELESLIPPDNCDASYQSILYCIQGQCREEATEFLSDIYEQDQIFFQIIAPKIFQVLPESEYALQAFKRYFDLKTAIIQRGYDIPEVFQILQDLRVGKLIQCQGLFINLMDCQQDLAIKIFRIICPVYPEFQIFEEKIYSKTAPQGISIQVAELLKQLSKQTQKDKIIVELLLQDIFNEDQIYYAELLKYLVRQYPFVKDLKQPLTFQQICMQGRSQIFKQFISNTDPMKPKLSIKEFMSINVEFNTQNAENDIVNFTKKEDKFQIKEICILLFDYIKRKCNFSHLIDKISKNQKDFYLTKQILFNLLMKNSDTYLRTMLFMACSTFMPVPLISYDWENSKLLLWKELFYTFEKRKAIFTLKLSKSQTKGPRGCTSLTNLLFNKDFETHNSKLTNFGSIDLQFDYNFASTLYVPVADAHGYLDTDVLRKIYFLFDIFIIHTINREEDKLYIKDEIREIQLKNKSSLIIIIEHDPSFVGEQYEIKKVSDKYFIFKSKPYNDLQEQVKINLKDEILELVVRDLQIENNYSEDITQRIKSLKLFIQLLRNFQIDDKLPKKAVAVIENFINLIKENCQNLCAQKFLPLNNIFAKRCQIFNSLKQESEMDSNKRETLTQELIKLDKDLENCDQARILKVFCQVIEFKNFLGLSSIVAKLTKGYLDNQLKPLLEQKTRLRGNLQIAGLTQEDRDKYLNEMQEITVNIENKSFSNEYVIRELYLLSMNQKEVNQQYRIMYTELAELQINQGQPFELIDGNNLQFVKGIYDQIYQDTDESVLVVSVIGPQSSGKSLLLNYLFGTQFQSAAGRCTKGVYGTILELNSSCQSTYKKILLLDTEGLQSIEGRDDRFDKRIVFFILCVSHVVLICNKGEMNSQMSEIIKLAADAISNLKEARVHGMSVNIVMNMLAHTDEAALEQCITKLSDALIEIQSGRNIQQLFHICKDNIFLLPFIYDSRGQDIMKVLQPSSDIAQKLGPLRKKILDKACNVDTGNQSIFTLKEQFSFAQALWTFTEQFKGIFDYKNLEQRREDKKLQDKMNSLIEEYFVTKQDEHMKDINKIIQKVLAQYQGFTPEINYQFQEMHQIINTKIQQDLDKFCGENNISISLRDKRSNFLVRRMNKYYTDWVNISNTQQALFTQKKSKNFGDERLQNQIQISMEQKDSFTDEEAIQKFHESWRDIQVQIAEMLKSREKVTDEIFALIRGYYENETLENVLKDNDQEYQQLQHFKRLGTQSLYTFFGGLEDRFFFFIGHQIKPNNNKIIALQERGTMFLVNLKKDLFVKSSEYVYFEWLRLMKDRFNLYELFDDIGGNLIDKDWKFHKFVDIKQWKIAKIINQLKNEAHQYDLDVKIDFIHQLQNLESTLLNNKQGCSNQQKIIDVSQLNNLFHQYRIQVKENLHQVFEYKKYIGKGHCQSRYFQKINPEKYYFRSNTLIIAEGLAVISKTVDIEFNQNKLVDFENEFYLKRYFKFLENRHDIPICLQSQETLRARQYFFQQLKIGIIIRQIETIVLQSYKRDGRFENETIDNWLINIKQDKTQKIRKEFCKIDRKIVQSIIMNIRNLIVQIDEEVEPFCLKISEYGISALNLIAQTFINALAEELEYDEQIAPLYIWQNSEEIQRNMFVAKLTSNDKATDIAVAKKTAVNVLQLIIQGAMNSTVDRFTKNILLIKKEFNKNNVIQRLEEFAIRAAEVQQMKALEKQPLQFEQALDLSNLQKEFGFTIDEVVAFYVDPKEFLQKKFLLEWGEQTNSLLRQCKIQYVNETVQSKQIVINFFNSLKQQLEIKNINQTSLSLFINQNYLNSDILIPNACEGMNQEDCSKAQAQYLVRMLRGDWDNKSVLQIQGGECYVSCPSMVLPLSGDVVKPPNREVVEEIINHLEGEKISKLDNFILEFVSQLQKQNINELQDVELIGNLLQDFKSTFVGCNEYCPLCRRECDQVHDEVELVNLRIHSCQDGHQYQCFGGSRLFETNEALTYGCDDIKDNDQIHYKGKQTKWSDFKQLFQQWEFKESGRRSLLNNKKNADIWNLIGPRICQYYNKINVGIQFVKANTISTTSSSQKLPVKVHYILLLDRSGSMHGQRWLDLINAVTDFLIKLEGCQSQIENSRVSIIGHDCSAKKICQKSIPSIKLVEKIDFTGGGNEFNLPLQMGLSFMEESYDSFDRFVLCFMSDGGCAYPQIAIRAIQSSRVFSRMTFFGIGYGNDPDIQKVMNPMAKALNGSMVIGLTPQELSSAFRKIIPNTYMT